MALNLGIDAKLCNEAKLQSHPGRPHRFPVRHNRYFMNHENANSSLPNSITALQDEFASCLNDNAGCLNVFTSCLNEDVTCLNGFASCLNNNTALPDQFAPCRNDKSVIPEGNVTCRNGKSSTLNMKAVAADTGAAMTGSNTGVTRPIRSRLDPAEASVVYRLTIHRPIHDIEWRDDGRERSERRDVRRSPTMLKSGRAG